MLQEFVVKEAFVGRRLLGDIFIQCCETKFSFLRQLYMFQVGEISGRFEKKGFSLKDTKDSLPSCQENHGAVAVQAIEVEGLDDLQLHIVWIQWSAIV
nr:hypothetical protein CFP56_14092 [Quercus suber]